MRSAAIVLRNNKNAVDSVGYAPIVDALTGYGYFLDELSLLSYEEVSLIHQKLIGFSEYDCVFIIADKVLVEGLKINLTERLSYRFEQNVYADERNFVCILTADEQGISCLNGIIPKLTARFCVQYDRIVVRMVGAPKETVCAAISEARRKAGETVVLNYTDCNADQRLEMIYNSITPKMVADEALRCVLLSLNDYVYALEDVSLAERVYDALRLRGRRLSVAESFTGGRISARLVSVSGISSVYHEGITAYANEAKSARLGVPTETLSAYGAVSAQTAYKMAKGLLDTGNCNVCVATTGLAGPKSDGTDKPIGLCYVAAGIDDKIYVNEYRLQGDRESITETAVNFALFSIFKLLKN